MRGNDNHEISGNKAYGVLEDVSRIQEEHNFLVGVLVALSLAVASGVTRIGSAAR